MHVRTHTWNCLTIWDSHVPSKRVAAVITLPGHAIYKNVELGSKPAKAYWNYPNTNYSSIRISGYSTSANSTITTPSPILDLKLLGIRPVVIGGV